MKLLIRSLLAAHLHPFFIRFRLSSHIRYPERSVFKLVKIFILVSESLPNIPLQAKKPFFLGKRGYIENAIVGGIRAKDIIEPMTEDAIGYLPGAAGKVFKRGRIAVKPVRCYGHDIVIVS